MVSAIVVQDSTATVLVMQHATTAPRVTATMDGELGRKRPDSAQVELNQSVLCVNFYTISFIWNGLACCYILNVGPEKSV